MPGLKPQVSRIPAQPKRPRKRRPHGFARRRMTPTRRVERVVECCPDCGTQLSGGWTQRTREVIELPQVPAEVTEHVDIARNCPACRRRCLPPAQLDGMVMGQQRLGVNLVSLIATLREEARLPIGAIQWYLRTVHGLRLSVGVIMAAVHRTAQSWTLRISSGVSEGIYKSVVQSDGEFLRIEAGRSTLYNQAA